MHPPEDKIEHEEIIPLGLIPIEDNTFEHDMTVSERYQQFSTELLRLSLLAMAALGFLLKDVLLSNKNEHNISDIQKTSMFGCLVLLAIAAASALWHRFIGPESVACQLKLLRLYHRNAVGDKDEYIKERKEREKNFELAGRLLKISGISLVLGVIGVLLLFILAV